MFGGVKSCGGGGSCIGGYLFGLWVRLSGFVVEIVIDRWWVSLEVWVILAWVSSKAWFKWWVLFGVGQEGCGHGFKNRTGHRTVFLKISGSTPVFGRFSGC